MASWFTTLCHYVFVACTFLYCVVILTCLASGVKETLFTSSPEIESGNNPPISSTHSAGSSVSCAILCSEDDTCVSFNFDAERRLCQMSDGVISISSGVVYTIKAECPADRGYKFYKRKDILLCIKIVATKVHQPTAEDDCESDGGHLLMIVNEAMHVFVIDILRTSGSGTSWVDGNDVYNNNTMISRTGEVIPYVEWAYDDPDHGIEDCLVISAFRDFMFRDAECAGVDSLGYICQISKV